MYRKILVALENSDTDQNLVAHIGELARLCRAELLLLHVADGWAARHFNDLKLQESEEIKSDRAYLESLAQRFREKGLSSGARLVMGNPPEKILQVAEEENCDLIAMSTHGHRWLGDLLHGSTIAQVRHKSTIPILLIRGQG